VVQKLAEACQPLNDEYENALTPYFGEALQVLFQNSKRDDYYGTGVDLMQQSYIAMTSLIQYSCSNSNTQTYEHMIPILQQLE
jgi:hypothetical protein